MIISSFHKNIYTW